MNAGLNITREVAALKRMTVKELRGRYLDVFGEATRSGNKDFLWKRIAWRMQANAEGDLTSMGRLAVQTGDKPLMPGTWITQPYKSRTSRPGPDDANPEGPTDAVGPSCVSAQVGPVS